MRILSSVVEQRIVGLVLCAHSSTERILVYETKDGSSILLERTTCNFYECLISFVVRGSTLIKPYSYAVVVQRIEHWISNPKVESLILSSRSNRVALTDPQ